jgi:HK97 family phage prohead protease
MSELRFAVGPITAVDVRDPSNTAGGETWTMSGYAAVFDQRTTLYDGKFVKVTETIDPAAFDPVLRDQAMSEPAGVVHFNLGHDMNRAVAATDVPAGQPGSLKLKADGKGLHFLAKVARDDPDGVALAAKMRSGVVRQASFAFTVARLESTDTSSDDGVDEIHDRILEIGRLYDVCACAQGAYAQTVSGLRSYVAALNLNPPGHPAGQPSQPRAVWDPDVLAEVRAAARRYKPIRANAETNGHGTPDRDLAKRLWDEPPGGVAMSELRDMANRFQPIAVLDADEPRAPDWGWPDGPPAATNCLRASVAAAYRIPLASVPAVDEDREDTEWLPDFLHGLARSGLTLERVDEPPTEGRCIAVCHTKTGLHAIVVERDVVRYDPARIVKAGTQLDTRAAAYYLASRRTHDRWGRRLAA